MRLPLRDTDSEPLIVDVSLPLRLAVSSSVSLALLDSLVVTEDEDETDKLADSVSLGDAVKEADTDFVSLPVSVELSVCRHGSGWRWRERVSEAQRGAHSG